MSRDRAWRRAQTHRFKARSLRDYRSVVGSEPIHPPSKTQHSLDCGRTCFMCHGDKLLDGRRRERYQSKRELRNA